MRYRIKNSKCQFSFRCVNPPKGPHPCETVEKRYPFHKENTILLSKGLQQIYTLTELTTPSTPQRSEKSVKSTRYWLTFGVKQFKSRCLLFLALWSMTLILLLAHSKLKPVPAHRFLLPYSLILDTRYQWEFGRDFSRIFEAPTPLRHCHPASGKWLKNLVMAPSSDDVVHGPENFSLFNEPCSTVSCFRCLSLWELFRLFFQFVQWNYYLTEVSEDNGPFHLTS